MFLIQNLCWHEFRKLRDSKKAPVCKVSNGNNTKCDAANLGCLLQQFLNLDDPDRTPPSCDETVNSVVARSEEISDICGARHFNLGDHRSCAVGLRVAAGAKGVLESVHGLELGSL